MWKKCILCVVVRGLVLMFGFVLSAPAGAEVLFSDDFAYANGTNLNGMGGWTAADATGNSVLNDDGLGDGGTDSLQYPGATSLDGRLYVQPGSGTIHHALPRPVTGEGSYLYTSFLYKPLSIPGTYWFQLDTTGSIQGQLGRIDGRGTGGQVELGCRIRNTTALSNKPIPLGQTALVVMKVTMVPGPSNDNVQLWVNPPVGVPEPPADATATETGNDINPVTGIIGFSFRIGQSNSGTKEVDLIRVGTTWEDVTSHPYLDARGPSPRDGAEDIPRDAVLSWVPGQFAKTHDVYFGTAFADVNTASRTNPKDVLVGQAQDAATYVPGLLAFGQTYYWRVDEVSAPPDSTAVKGGVWSFTAEPYAYPITNITATASSSHNADMGPEKTANGSGLDAAGLHGTTDNTMWLSSGSDSKPAWIQFQFDRLYKLDEMRVWNSNQSIESFAGLGARNVTVEYSTDGSTWTPLAGVPEFAKATGAPGYAYNTTVDFAGVAAMYVKLTIHSNWGTMTQTGLSEVRFYHVPGFAREPNPVSGATDTDVDVTLNWRAGREAARHNVYLSTDQQAVINQTAPVATVTSPSYASFLNLASTYYWRVDEVNDVETPKTWQGDIWSLSTQEYLVVDDFEAYNDIEAGQEGSNLVYVTWADGYANPTTNGSTIGYATGASMETSTAYDGKQSVPLSYNNIAAGLSEVTANVANLQVGQDWTKHGIKGLTLRFFGDPNNVPQQMYMKVNGTKVVYDGDAENIRLKGWQMWYIDLASLGVNLSTVTTLTIGLERIGGVGGQGKVLLDGIRLYSYDRQLITPTDPGTTGLQAQYQFEGNANDSSGKGRNGAIQGSPLFVAGRLGQAIKLDGARDFVQIDSSFELPVYFIALWFRIDGGTGSRDLLSVYNSTGGHGIILELTSANQLRYLHRFPFGTSGGNNIYSSPYDVGGWHHAVIAKSAEAMMLYVDGLSVGTLSDSTQFDQALTMVMGVLMHNNASRLLPGAIDEVRIYDRALSHGEAAGLAGSTVPFDKPF